MKPEKKFIFTKISKKEFRKILFYENCLNRIIFCKKIYENDFFSIFMVEKLKTFFSEKSLRKKFPNFDVYPTGYEKLDIIYDWIFDNDFSEEIDLKHDNFGVDSKGNLIFFDPLFDRELMEFLLYERKNGVFKN